MIGWKRVEAAISAAEGFGCSTKYESRHQRPDEFERIGVFLAGVSGTAVTVLSRQTDDYISLTDIAKHKEPDRVDQVIQNWMRNRNTVEFLGIWENLNNPDFKPLEFEGFRNRSGLNSFVLTHGNGRGDSFPHLAGLTFQGGAACGFLLSAQDGTAFLEAGGELLEEFVVGVERGHQACWLRRMASSIS
jgi:hypothetical protein